MALRPPIADLGIACNTVRCGPCCCRDPESMVAELYDASEFLKTYIAQGRLNERGNYGEADRMLLVFDVVASRVVQS